MDYSKQKQITTEQTTHITELRNQFTNDIAAIREKVDKQSIEDRSFMEKQINELKAQTTEHDSETDRKLEELYNWRIEASKGQARIETTLNMLEKNMLSQFENLNKKLDKRSS